MYITEDEGQLMLEGLNGFLMFVNRKGTIRFVSNTIKFHLGLEQVYLVCYYVNESKTWQENIFYYFPI